MAKYSLKIVDDIKALSDRADEVNPDEPIENVKRIINDIKRTLKDHKDLVALCAPQIGSSKRIFCIKFADNTIRTFVNPMIVSSEGLHLSRETNASIRGKEFIIPRHDKIKAMYQTDKGNIEENSFDGMSAEVFEQMFYMLDGILISDYGLEVLDGFDKATKKDKEKIISMYFDYLKSMDENMAKEIEENKDLRDIKKGIEFLESVAKGETEVVPEINGELDFSQSTKTRIEAENKADKARIEKIIEKYGSKK